MHSRISLAVASTIAITAGLCLARTPPGFQPSSDNDLIVTFGPLLATGGVYITEIQAADQPELYTYQPLQGSYTLLMVDPDNPPSNASSTGTEEFLHWVQPGLVSSETSSIVNGKTVYELINPNNVSAFAPYLPPGPPFQFPFIHRYIQLLLNTTTSPNNSVLAAAAQNRRQFHVLQVVTNAGVSVVAGNWFNSSDPRAVAGNSTGSSNATTTATATPTTYPTYATTNGAGLLSGREGAAMKFLVLVYAFAWLVL